MCYMHYRARVQEALKSGMAAGDREPPGLS